MRRRIVFVTRLWYPTEYRLVGFEIPCAPSLPPPMQRPNLEKRAEILEAATKLFAAKPFHEVRLEDIASEAGVGKGTLYVYFQSKDDLYIRLIRDGFARVAGKVREGVSHAADARTKLAVIAQELVEFAFSYPDLYRVMRSGSFTPDDGELQRSRQVLVELLIQVLKEGTRSAELNDPFPELTAQFILSFVRGAALYPPKGMTKERLRDHLLHILMRGIGPRRLP